MKEVDFLKEISKSQIESLIQNKTIRNTKRGYINCNTGYGIGFYRTKGVAGKRYVEDKYVDIANRISEQRGVITD